ncbi:flagellin lysine-N-methylase [Citrobacter sp. wls620]|uniref:flagellin lysine-N-methylase n=1 Tax=Citrobacter sp. wls620 TaxID=2576431 RepID=UPI0010C977E1|nr:flagellin lysine-N-methylase [Citrobacter sp. wls620]TKU93580.1 hypothetical protein FDW90_09185 [Citrobacter sp. wls620]
MQEITVTEPNFVTTFQCTGTQCRDHCCKGWNIHLDKTTVNKYVSSKNEIIKNIAKENIILLKKDIAQWGVIKLADGTGNCPYLTEESLCQVQKTLGAQALSTTCQTFPRVERVYKNDVRKSLNLSCPEVVGIVLTDPNAMILNEKSTVKPQANVKPALTPQQKLLNLFCLSLVDQAGRDINVGFYSLIKLTLFIEKFQSVDNAALSEIEPVYHALLGKVRTSS